MTPPHALPQRKIHQKFLQLNYGTPHWLDQLCPLTLWEHQLRVAAGQSGYQRSFIEHWLSDLIFVDLSLSVLALVYTGFGLLVCLTLWWVPIGSARTAPAVRTPEAA